MAQIEFVGATVADIRVRPTLSLIEMFAVSALTLTRVIIELKLCDNEFFPNA